MYGSLNDTCNRRSGQNYALSSRGVISLMRNHLSRSLFSFRPPLKIPLQSQASSKVNRFNAWLRCEQQSLPSLAASSQKTTFEKYKVKNGWSGHLPLVSNLHSAFLVHCVLADDVAGRRLALYIYKMNVTLTNSQNGDQAAFRMRMQKLMLWSLSLAYLPTVEPSVCFLVSLRS